jgi:hypothetical protein
MSRRWKERLRAGRRWLLKPFKKIELSIRKRSQRFVLKTVATQPPWSGKGGSVASMPQHALLGPLASGGSICDATLHAFMRSMERTVGASSDRISGCLVSADRFLAPHPLVGFLYTLPTDRVGVAYKCRGMYQPEVTQAIRIWVDDQPVVHHGPRDGYHLLTSLASCPQGQGAVLIDEPSGSWAEVLRENIECHRLERQAMDELTWRRMGLPIPSRVVITAVDPELDPWGTPVLRQILAQSHSHICWWVPEDLEEERRWLRVLLGTRSLESLQWTRMTSEGRLVTLQAGSLEDWVRRLESVGSQMLPPDRKVA